MTDQITDKPRPKPEPPPALVFNKGSFVLPPGLLTFICLLPTIVCVIIGGVLCFYNKDGWGWFLFAALLLHGIPQMNSK